MQEIRTLQQLGRVIVNCDKCSRLVAFRRKVAEEKRKQFVDFDYWGRPITGYGDPQARLIVIGLAPAKHGGNRTGRVFTGDSSAKFLVRHLYEAGFANQPTSEAREDGLEYKDCYVTAAVRCVPPYDKPSGKEIKNCLPYFGQEVRLLVNAKAILALGRTAFGSVIYQAKKNFGLKESFRFQHGKKYVMSSGFPVVYASYHPSPRNTNTGKLTSKMFRRVLKDVKNELDIENPSL